MKRYPASLQQDAVARAERQSVRRSPTRQRSGMMRPRPAASRTGTWEVDPLDSRIRVCLTPTFYRSDHAFITDRMHDGNTVCNARRAYTTVRNEQPACSRVRNERLACNTSRNMAERRACNTVRDTCSTVPGACNTIGNNRRTSQNNRHVSFRKEFRPLDARTRPSRRHRLPICY